MLMSAFLWLLGSYSKIYHVSEADEMHQLSVSPSWCLAELNLTQ